MSKNVSPRKSPVTCDTFVGSEEICFTPGFPVNGPKFGVLSVFTHVETAESSVSSLLSLSFALCSLSL